MGEEKQKEIDVKKDEEKEEEFNVRDDEWRNL